MAFGIDLDRLAKILNGSNAAQIRLAESMDGLGASMDRLAAATERQNELAGGAA